MTLLYADPRFRLHETGRHPERPARVSAIEQRLDAAGLTALCTRPTWQPATLERVARVHDLDYAAAVRQFAEAGGGLIEADTVVSPASYEVALLAAGAAVDAVQRVVRGEDRTALCLVRPPGHHALRSRPMGFCLLNNVAIAARVATAELGLRNVLIVDWDVHHGNATQDAFWTDGQVAFLSIHRWPFYPGTGAEDETGSGAGLGRTVNVPVAFGTSRRDYLAQFTAALDKLADRVRPELVLVSAGFDAHRDDPVGSLGLEADDFAPLTQAVLEVARVHAGGRLVSLLEGGYDLQALAACAEIHLRDLLACNTVSDCGAHRARESL
jgi:acetoin utilization deacetylase AcuC-like enzyme